MKAGLFLIGGNSELYDSTITKNSTLFGEGGGIYSLGPTSVVILDNTIISENRGVGNGGGINNTNANSSLIIRNGSKIIDNQSKLTGGGIYNEGKLTITSDCQISGNTANTADEGRRGGGMYNIGALVNTSKEILLSVIKDNQPDDIFPVPE